MSGHRNYHWRPARPLYRRLSPGTFRAYMRNFIFSREKPPLHQRGALWKGCKRAWRRAAVDQQIPGFLALAILENVRRRQGFPKRSALFRLYCFSIPALHIVRKFISLRKI